jgi:hypothetical protein
MILKDDFKSFLKIKRRFEVHLNDSDFSDEENNQQQEADVVFNGDQSREDEERWSGRTVCSTRGCRK